MTIEFWREIVGKCATDPEMAELAALTLKESQDAKQLLRDAGFGVTGTSLLETVKEALEREKKRLEAAA